MPNVLKGALAGVVAAGTFVVTQTTWSVTAKDIVYIVLVFIAALTPGIYVPPAPKQDATKYNTPPTP